MRRHFAHVLVLGLASCTEHSPGWHNITDEAPDTTSTTDVPDSDTAAQSTGASTSSTGTTAAASTDGAEAGQDATGEPDTSTTTTTGAVDETTGSEPQCGNGMLEPLALPPEECDDGNLLPADGCGDTCAVDRIMFVSSALYSAGDFKSLYFADAVCAQAAEDVGLPNWLKFRAWLSDSTIHARDRFKFSRGRIVLVNGLVVADSWIDLLAGKLQNPIDVTENGETYHGGVWTGTNPQGVGVPGAMHCDDWTSFSIDKFAYYGYSDRATSEWTLSALDDNPSPCPTPFAVYCLEER